MEWISPNTITGSPAENEKYLRRQLINDDFWFRIANGEHILFTSPRRVGKSSIMKDLEKNCPEGYIAIYQNIESDKSQKEFYKRIFTLLLQNNKFKTQVQKGVTNWLKSKKITEVSASGTFKIEGVELDYKFELLNLIEELGKEKVKVVMMLDEFPDVINSIMKNEGNESAIETLHTLRSIRHDEKFKNFFFVFAGSIGLEHIVNSLDRPKLINDLFPIYIEELSKEEAQQLVSKLISGATMQIDHTTYDYFLVKIGHLLPYFIQLMIEKCDSILRKTNNPELTIEVIEKAYITVIEEGRNFADWEKRLKKYLDKKNSEYCISILTRIAHHEPFTIQEAYNYTKICIPNSDYKELLDDVLKKDGYIVEQENGYKFLSPFLKEWWKDRHQEFEIED